MISDDAYLLFSNPSYAEKGAVAKLVRTANMRIGELPHSSGCRGLIAFRGSAKDKQANFTGKQRRMLCAFMPFAVMGLNSQKTTDNDPLLEAALYCDQLQSVLRGVNFVKRSGERTMAEIKKLQQLVAEACNAIMDCFG